ncbi:MAG: hypothetical protein KKB13_16565 [Chloroflexi bacterium]|nr:hypothetical protein [Chloroflexota bacterium]
MRTLTLSIILLIALSAGLAGPLPAQATSPVQPGQPRYVSGALYTAPYGRGTYLGWAHGLPVLRSEGDHWHYTAQGWVHGTVSPAWTGAWPDRVWAGLSYWGQFGQAPAAW